MVLVCLLVTLSAAAADGRSKPRYGKCAAALRGADPVRADATAIVYTKNAYDDRASRQTLDLYSCLRATGRHRHLDGNGVDELQDTFRLRGRYFAWASYLLAGPASAPALGGVNVVDLRGRKKVVSAPFADGGQQDASLSSLILGPHGELAWISQTGSASPQSTTPLSVQVWVSYHGRTTKLDTAPDIAPTSLRLSADGGTVLWTRGGQAESAASGSGG